MFLDNLPAFNYNPGAGEYIVVNGQRVRTDTHELGSTLVEMMLKEVEDFCDPNIKDNWSHKAHQQVSEVNFKKQVVNTSWNLHTALLIIRGHYSKNDRGRNKVSDQSGASGAISVHSLLSTSSVFRWCYCKTSMMNIVHLLGV